MPRFLHELLTASAAARPDHFAICWKEDLIPYGELDRLTNQLAQTLKGHNTRPGDRVVVLIPNSPNALLAVLGALKAGCIAVPIDMATPTKRLAEILLEVHPSAILTARATRPVLDDLLATYFLEDHAFASITIGTLEAFPIQGEHFETAFSGIDVLKHSADPIPCRATSKSPALHLFSCGEVASEVSGASQALPISGLAFASPAHRPTIVTHADVLAYLDRAVPSAKLGERDRVAGLPLLSPHSVAMTFATLAAGAELHLIPHEILCHPKQLAAFVRAEQLTDWQTNHGVLSELIHREVIHDGDFPALKRLSWIGDPLPPSKLRDLQQRLPLTQFTRVASTTALKLSDQPLVVEIPSDLEAVEPLTDAEPFVVSL